ncbi:alpha/beta hydrolase [Kineococcus rhizosphaerae]|uniref:Acetyl esterase/lipase n=1 Tax=Kineococcus rhizosphaerae TaxID=559628 RepID=A0A2T0RB32_9ACTN|nr:alpha/beta hydrolase [Kineococcus rhizosphaerae]PRY18378.1 acetyl esterase/lipase [Kineococcus rhizosphaerae]
MSDPLPGRTLPRPPAVDGWPLPDPASCLAGLAYSTPPGARPLELDLHRPATSDVPPPVVLYLHGGGWAAGDRRWVGAQPGATVFAELTGAGFAVAALDYRLSSEARWPAQLDDVRAAVEFLRTRAPELGIDATRIGVWGESAGGHLALLLGVSGAGLGPVVSWYAPTDLTTLAGDGGTDPDDPASREALLLGAPVSAVPDRAADASPVHRVVADVVRGRRFLVLHGEDDRFVAARQGERVVRALDGAGALVEQRSWPGADHLWLGHATAAAEALTATVRFFTDHL